MHAKAQTSEALRKLGKLREGKYPVLVVGDLLLMRATDIRSPDISVTLVIDRNFPNERSLQ